MKKINWLVIGILSSLLIATFLLTNRKRVINANIGNTLNITNANQSQYEYSMIIEVLCRAASYLFMGTFLLGIHINSSQNSSINAIVVSLNNDLIINCLGWIFCGFAVGTVILAVLKPFIKGIPEFEKRVYLIVLPSIFAVSLVRIIDVLINNFDNAFLRWSIFGFSVLIIFAVPCSLILNEIKLRKDVGFRYYIEFSSFRLSIVLLLLCVGILLFGATSLGNPLIYLLLGLGLAVIYIILLFRRRRNRNDCIQQ